MSLNSTAPKYHALLIGIDRYPPRYRSLSGCINDIDAIERLLLQPPGIGIPPERVRITRLAALRAGRTSTSTLQDKTLPPTKANVVAALRKLAGPDVGPDDRVLIFYSGHGDEKQWTGSQVWHEALIPHDDRDVEYLFDVEINALIAAIAERTADLTVVLDCCHSAGAARDLVDVEPQGAVRSLESDDTPVPAPDFAALGIEAGDDERGLGGPILQAADPSYLVITACQPDEKANEGGASIGEMTHGVFTHSLLGVLAGRDAEQLGRVRWADVWPDLLARSEARNVRLGQRSQHPWIIGRGERRIFGGPWEKTDVGYPITRLPNGDYEVGAGRLMGITNDAEIAVYGPQPSRFPAIGSTEDKPIGRLKVTDAGRSSSLATLLGETFPLEGARGRLVKPGSGQALRVSVKPQDAVLEAKLAGSSLLAIVEPAHPDAEVEVVRQPNGDWIIGNEVEQVLALVPAGDTETLIAALEHYTRYNTAVRMARECSDPQLAQSLTVQILDASDEAALAAMTPEQLADPNFAEAPRDKDRVYSLPNGFRFCVRVTNNSTHHLNVALFDCTASGVVEYLSDATLRDGAAHVMWLDNHLGERFWASPDMAAYEAAGLPTPGFVTDRIVALGTTRPDVELSSLWVEESVQQIVDIMRGGAEAKGSRPPAPAAPAELWTATVAPIRMLR